MRIRSPTAKGFSEIRKTPLIRFETLVCDAKPTAMPTTPAAPSRAVNLNPRFRSSEYYRQYCERTHLLDEMDFLVDVAAGTVLVLVVGRRKKMFTKAELGRLRLIGATVRAAMRNIWERWVADSGGAGRDENLHERLTRCFETFGEASLTDREREITQLLLRGHSVKSVARELDIAPGTVMVHKRNLFAKLGISSQYQLFSRFIEDLSRV